MVITTWAIAMYRHTQTICHQSAATGEVPSPAMAPLKPGTHLLAVLGTNLMLFSAIIFLAWSAHDRVTAVIIVGVMLALSVWHFFHNRGQPGIPAAVTYIAQLASSCAVMLAIFNLRFDPWAASWYGVGIEEIRRLVPTRTVPLLTLVLALWAGLLLVLTRPKRGIR
jgi:hypothetical protein